MRPFILLLVLAVPLCAQELGFRSGHHAVFFGDSITFNGSYGQLVLSVLEERYPEADFRITSRGVHGDTAERAKGRVATEIVPLAPDWVFLKFGTNDVGRYEPAEFLRHYEALLDAISAGCAARLAIISPIFPDRDRRGERDEKLALMVDGLRALAARRGLLYVPAYETFKAIRSDLPAGFHYAPDGSHPNRVGYWIIAQAILEAWGYPCESRERLIDIPAEWLGKPRDAALAGREVVISLPEPLRVRIGAWQPRTAVATNRVDSPQIDGDLADWDLSAPLVLGPADRTIGVIGRSSPAFVAKAWVTWNETGLSVAVQVEDDIIRHSPGARSVFRDNVELFLDLRSPAERAATGSDYARQRFPGTAQIIMAPAGGVDAPAAIEVASGDPAVITAASFASQRTATGYVVECRIPASLSAGDTIGFDWSVNDLDHADAFNTATQLRWSGAGSSSFSLADWGMLSLAD